MSKTYHLKNKVVNDLYCRSEEIYELIFILEEFVKRFLDCAECNYAIPLIKHIKERSETLYCKLMDVKDKQNEFADLR